MDYSVIKRELKKKRLQLKEMFDFVGISEQGYYAMIRNNSMKIETFEKICEFLGISPARFFDPGGPPLEFSEKEKA